MSKGAVEGGTNGLTQQRRRCSCRGWCVYINNFRETCLLLIKAVMLQLRLCCYGDTSAVMYPAWLALASLPGPVTLEGRAAEAATGTG